MTKKVMGSSILNVYLSVRERIEDDRRFQSARKRFLDPIASFYKIEFDDVQHYQP